MNKMIALLAGLALSASAIAEDYNSSDGWKPLFNGKDLSDFTIEDGQASYEVKDGVITGTTAIPSPNTFLATKAVYGDFELVFDVKVSDKLNSGVQIRSRSRSTDEGRFKVGRFYGPQVEIEAGRGQAGYIYGEATGRGWLSPEPQSKDPAVKAHSLMENGEWNHFRIIAKGSRIQTFINGKPVADLVDEEIYKTHPEGHIGLQIHSINEKNHPMTVSWKNLQIRELHNAEKEWISLFNGEDLDGWLVKIAKSELGENPGEIFRVVNGYLTVSYEDFEGPFNRKFGHIFIDQPFTNYHFRCEYRFIGEQIEGGPDWAWANSGVMLHGQDPRTMAKGQPFPNSIEFQFLAQDDSGTRASGSVCTPGTTIDINGERIVKHVTQSDNIAPPLNEWVTAEAIVKDGVFRHIINGQTVIEYSDPRYDDGSPVTAGWISLQAESHPCQFRNIEIKVLE